MSKSSERAQRRLAQQRKGNEQETAKTNVESNDENIRQEPSESTPIEEIPKATPVSNFAQAAEKVEATGVEPIAPVEPVTTATRGVLPDVFGNNVKGERICSVCGIKESETLAKNPRYSFCKGKCVNCYGKTERKTTKPEEMTPEQIQAKIDYYKDLLAKKVGAQGLPERNAVENTTVDTTSSTIETHGANLDAKADELAVVETE